MLISKKLISNKAFYFTPKKYENSSNKFWLADWAMNLILKIKERICFEFKINPLKLLITMIPNIRKYNESRISDSSSRLNLIVKYPRII